ncbi:hypothetical protein SAMN05216551_10411 [Chitinasiproducens palmae]|uniref:Uncharacterized protein n=1 Tax=Chitinasiproducens palmae TaxID=1770053 RepID=A0A1H2PMP2_9BURK|nr:hypothetical protein SAMN05216551_10411 [Chitinasiproducens palmae]
MPSYRCHFLNEGQEPSASLVPSIQVQAPNAVEAARLTQAVTGCAIVVDVERVAS